MTASNIRFWGGEEWEEYIQSLLKRYYGPGNYQELPAKHGGDFGIEGYSTDGCAYQCYAKQEPCTTLELYEAQRDKITTDIGKFMANKVALVKLFGGTLINRWILVVPRHESASLAQHASKKTEEVLRVGLPYVSDDFKIIIVTDSSFKREMNELANAGVIRIEIDTKNLEIEARDRKSWLESNDCLVENLHIKANKIPKLSADKNLEVFKHHMIDNYLRGQNLLSYISENFPDIYVKLNTCKRTYEYHLQTTSLIIDNKPDQHLIEAIEGYSCELGKSVPSLPSETIMILKSEAVSDWLMRCPLDF
jgi:hypothetical protein